MNRLTGKKCVITGAASGIGAASARLFVEEGATVVGIDLRPSPEASLSIEADITDEQAVADAYAAARQACDHLDVLFNNAGVTPAGDVGVLDEPTATFEDAIAVNLRGLFLCCKHGIPHLLDSPGGGSVINMASFVAVMGAATSQSGYTAAKGGVLALSRELGVELARKGVRVNAICPGPVDTPLLRELYSVDSEAAARRLVHLPMGRFAFPNEIASAALFLASDDSSYITASTFMVDGGLSAAYVTPE